MAGAGPEGRVQPDEARSSAEFVAEMRRLRNWSGLSFREMEARADANGDVLPHSTLVTALRRDSLPREDLVAAFTRACGCTPAEVTAWIKPANGWPQVWSSTVHRPHRITSQPRSPPLRNDP